MMNRLTKQDIDAFVTAYLGRDDLRESDDPIDDLVNLVILIYGQTSALDIGAKLPLFSVRSGKFSFDLFVDASANHLHHIAPSISKTDWADIFGAILSGRYGGMAVDFKARRAAQRLNDAGAMMPRELMEKHGISRRHAFRLRKKALTRK